MDPAKELGHVRMWIKDVARGKSESASHWLKFFSKLQLSFNVGNIRILSGCLYIFSLCGLNVHGTEHYLGFQSGGDHLIESLYLIR
ncbi:Uncharacterized protein TCM_025704 [Theobroma cacao]|uniref:Uncharacterized protein n=1 Tax=Theobroma cacao TaxID=3641 RepID=A0A061EZV2_THECC|nr:Uncharacterized protein TCM_025704 [Theobroma cacao]